MLRLGDLTEGERPVLRWAVPSGAVAADRVLSRVVRCTDGVPDGRTARALLVVPAEEHDALGGIEDAAAVVLVGAGAGALPVASGLPMLVPADPTAGPDAVAYRLVSELSGEVVRAGEGMERVLDLMARGVVDGQGPDRLLAFAQRYVQQHADHPGPPAQVVMVRRRAQWPGPLTERGGEVEQLVHGAAGYAALQVPLRWRSQDGRTVLVWPLGAVPPHPLLVMLRAGPDWSVQQRQRLDHLAALTDALTRGADLAAREQRLRRASRTAGVAGLRHLLAGDSVTAARLLDPLAPHLLDGQGAAQLRIAVVLCERADRSGVTDELEQALGSEGLAVPAQEYITVLSSAESVGELKQVLGPVLQRRAGRCAGIGPVGPARQAGQLHGLAVRQAHAAAAAGGGVAVHEGQRELPDRLPGSARAWARQFAAPLATPERRERLVPVCLAVHRQGVPGAAETLGLHRHTIENRLAQAYRLCNLDRGRFAHRAVLDLALRLSDLPAPGAGVDPDPGADTVLTSAPAQAWAWEMLEDLPPQLLAVLAGCVRTGSISGAAEGLGISRRHARARLQRAAALLHLPLTSPREGQPGPWHEAAWALHASARLDLDLPNG